MATTTLEPASAPANRPAGAILNLVRDDMTATENWDRELNERHAASFVAGDSTLVVCFTAANPHPKKKNRGFAPDLAKEHGWSLLNVTNTEPNWFRDAAVFALFDDLIDAAFFDQFDRVIFFGIGMHGYAAAAFSVAAPGADVLVVAPQATLDPDRTAWDNRFPEARALDFTCRYGYAPDMVEVNRRCHILFDSAELLDAVHASLFHGQNVMHHDCTHLGKAMERPLLDTGILREALIRVVESDLSQRDFTRLRRARRPNATYLRNLSRGIDLNKTPLRLAVLCMFAQRHVPGAYFERRLELAIEQIEKTGPRPAWLRDPAKEA